MILKRGMESPDVLNLEIALQTLGFTNFLVDGVFDEKTENVIRYIQKNNGLVDDGIAGDKTLILIQSLLPDDNTPVIISVPTIEDEDFELKSVHPKLTNKILLIKNLAKEEGYHITVIAGLRTFAEQDKLFAKRPRVTKARGGQSYHNYGLAVDMAFVINSNINWDDHFYTNLGRWASRFGVEWGGHWRFVDKPHLQLPNLPATRKLLEVYNQGGIANVWKRFIT